MLQFTTYFSKWLLNGNREDIGYPNSAMQRVFHTRFKVNYAYKINLECQICPCFGKY